MTPDNSDLSKRFPEPAEDAYSAIPPTTLRSEDLLRGGRDVQIVHAGEVYKLSVTRNGKLILTK